MSYSVKYYLISISYAVAYSIILFVSLFNYNKQTHLLLLGAVCCYSVLANIILAIYMSNIKRNLYKRCDPDRFLTVMFKNYPSKNEKYRGLDVTYDIVRGLCAAGRFEEALAELNKIDDFPTGFFGEPKKRFYYEYLVLIYTSQKDIAEAETALESLRQIAYDKELSIAKQNSIKKQYEESAILLNIAKGEYDGAEEFLTNKFINAKNNYARVFAKYYLGVIYSHLGEEVKAHEAFAYAAEHGNKLKIASLAREHLSNVNLLV